MTTRGGVCCCDFIDTATVAKNKIEKENQLSSQHKANIIVIRSKTLNVTIEVNSTKSQNCPEIIKIVAEIGRKKKYSEHEWRERERRFSKCDTFEFHQLPNSQLNLNKVFNKKRINSNNPDLSSFSTAIIGT